MDNSRWDKFLDEAVDGIRDKVTRAEVREELFDHLEDRKERFKMFGDSDEEAEKKSVEAMGDCSSLKHKLGALHTRCYVSELDGVFLKIFTGFLFTFFKFDFFGLGIMSIVGSILIFAGCYQLRNINSTLKKAWWASLVSAVYSCFMIIGKAIPFFTQLSDNESFAVVLVGIAVTAISTVLLFAGIKTLENCALVGKKITTPSLTGAGVAYVLAQIIGIYAALLEMDEPNEGYGTIGAFIILPLFIYILYVLWGVRKAIVSTEYRTESVSEFDKKGYGILSGFAVLLVAALIFSCLTVAKPRVKSEVYVSPERTAEVEEIRKELIENGFPENVANILPDEEIKKCYPLYHDSEIFATTGNTQSNSENPYDGKPRIDIVAVPIYTEDGVHRDIRLIYTFEYLNSEDMRGYRDSILAMLSTAPARNSDSYGVFYKKDNVLYREEPLRLYRNDFGIVYGFEFRTVEDADEMYGYIALNGIPTEHFTPIMTYCLERYPLNYPYYSAYDKLKVVSAGTVGGESNPQILSKISCDCFQTWLHCYYPYAGTDDEEVPEETTDEEVFTQDEMNEVFN